MIYLTEILEEPKTGIPFKKNVWRGDDISFSKFDKSYIGKKGFDTVGFWFADTSYGAEYYGSQVREFTITMKNPMVITSEDFINAFPHGPTFFAKLAKSKGHDGCIILDIVDGDTQGNVYCVFSPNQIKKSTSSYNP